MTMRQTQNIGRLLLAFCGLVILSGCATGAQGSRTTYGDTNERDLLGIGVTMTDLKELAGEVTQKFLRSPQVRDWSPHKPKLVLGALVNNTDDESIQMTTLSDLVTDQVLGSGLIRLLDTSADNFEYILRQSLTSKRQYGQDDKQILHFTMQMKLFDLEGELIGQWSHDIKQVQSARRTF